ncbi:hypothetical protein ACFLTH_02350 [Bacteroidota bacterium]
MGQQQLLLIVLGIIIVGIAVVVGINLFTASASEENRDAVVLDMTNIAMTAQKYLRTPRELGGGGRSYRGFRDSDDIDTTLNGTYTVRVRDQDATIIGIGVEKGDNETSNVKVTMVITPSGIRSITYNN